MTRTPLSAIVLLGSAALGQTPPDVTPSVLEVDVENVVQYRADIAEPAKRGTEAAMTTAAPARPFTDVLFIGDIVAVNGRPAKGTWTSRQYLMNLNPNAAPGNAIADINRSTLADCKWEFLGPDGAFVGALTDSGFAPHAVTGGVGAFLGAKGQMAGVAVPNAKPIRVASMSEDPANRRTLGGGTNRIVFHLYPLFRPSIVGALDSDFRRIDEVHPARRGDSVILRVLNLGPTSPGTVPPGMQPFPQDPLAQVNSHVEAVVNGRGVPVGVKVGWPGELNVYRVDLRLPDDIPPGVATVVISAAWISSQEFRIPVR